jgi:hypothetical protein
VLLVVVAVLGQPWQAVVLELESGPTRCDYDAQRRAVVTRVPLAVATRGEVELEVQALVYDRRDPDRQPYLTTRTLTVDTGGEVERPEVVLEISMRQQDWRAGFDDCAVRIRTVDASSGNGSTGG